MLSSLAREPVMPYLGAGGNVSKRQPNKVPVWVNCALADSQLLHARKH